MSTGEVPAGTARPAAAGDLPGGRGVVVGTSGAAVMEAQQKALDELIADGVPAALAASDPRLWGPDAEPEASIRLGWLQAAQISRPLTGEIGELAARARADGLEHVVLAGMGGSSLAPEVITRTVGAPLTVLDTTDPHQVGRVLGDRLDRTLLVVSSKSGSTIETDSHRRIYEHAFASLGLTPAQVSRRIVVVTDPGSPLADAAGAAGYHVVLADPNVGGRYSALTAFGLVPSGLAGADVAALLDEADQASPDLDGSGPNPGLALGAVLGGYAREGHDKAVLADCGSGIRGFGDWAEQLIAESTGKNGRGILPVVVSGEDAPGFSPGPDIHLIGLGTPASPADTTVAGPLGAQFLVWEYAVAIAGRLCGINPFDQPNVAESKQNTLTLLDEAGDGPLPPGSGVHRRRGRGARGPGCPAHRGRPRRGAGRGPVVAASGWLPGRHGLPGPGGGPGSGPAARRAGRQDHPPGHLRLGSPVPAFHRPVPQGRAGHRGLPPDHRERPAGPARARAAVHPGPASARPGTR